MAEMLDKSTEQQVYVATIAKLHRAIASPELTYSGQLLAQLKARTPEQGSFGIELANNYKNLQ